MPRGWISCSLRRSGGIHPTPLLPGWNPFPKLLVPTVPGRCLWLLSAWSQSRQLSEVTGTGFEIWIWMFHSSKYFFQKTYLTQDIYLPLTTVFNVIIWEGHESVLPWGRLKFIMILQVSSLRSQLECWNNGIMGDLVLLHFVQEKFTMLKEGKWKIGLSAKFPLKGKTVKLLYE